MKQGFKNMKFPMISGIALAAALLTQSAFALEHSQGQGANTSWISAVRGPSMSIDAATLSVSTDSAKLQSLKGQAILATNDGSQLNIDGKELKVVRVSGTSQDCGRVFGFVGVRCSFDNAIVTIQNAEGEESAVSAEASVTWINQDILISLGSEDHRLSLTVN